MAVEDKIKVSAQLSVLKDVVVDYKGKTIDNIIQQMEARLNVL